MITAGGRTALGLPLLFLGLSGENITRLVAGEPIVVPVTRWAELGMPMVEIVIHYGKTEEMILADMRGHGLLRDDPGDR